MQHQLKTARRSLLGCTLLALSMSALSGCAGVGQVQPWEKGTLARPEMTIQGDALESRFAEHIYSSREASSGGAGVGGGGCGCN